MLRRVASCSLLLLVLAAGPAPAQVEVKGEAVYAPYKKIELRASGGETPLPKTISYLWDVDGTTDPDVVEAGPVLYVWAQPGTYKVLLTAVDFESKKVSRARFTFRVGGTPPVPPGPEPPEPPVPPTPTKGLRVLILYETADASKMPAAQQQILFNQAMRTWLSAKCDADNQTASGKAWRIADRDQDFSGLSPAWQKMMAAGKSLTMPAVVIAGADGTAAYVGPLPATIAEAQALVSKYAPSTTPSKRKAG